MQKQNDNALCVDHLTVYYDQHPVLWDLCFSIPQGHLVGIVGPNGAGKSTFIKACLGLLKTASGKVTYWGEHLKTARPKIAYIPQRESVDWDFPITVNELVMMGRYGKSAFYNRNTRQDQIRVQETLELVGLAPFAKRQISQLSGGQQQRAFLARALVQDADLYFMDEPFSGVDLTTEKILTEQLLQIRQLGKTVFVVHHDLNSVKETFDWVLLLNLKLIACGPVSTTFTPHLLEQTFGRHFSLLDEALKMSKSKQLGLGS